jgi:hypothetical protein
LTRQCAARGARRRGGMNGGRQRLELA